MKQLSSGLPHPKHTFKIIWNLKVLLLTYSFTHSHTYLLVTDTINDNSRHLVVVDKVLKSLVGMISVVDNSPGKTHTYSLTRAFTYTCIAGNLTARLDNIWLTPAFQNKLYGYDMMLTALSWLFETGYRRVTIELDRYCFLLGIFTHTLIH